MVKTVIYICIFKELERIFLEIMIEKLSLSATAYYRTIKVARTIADLDKSAEIQRAHLIEAVGCHRFNY